MNDFYTENFDLSKAPTDLNNPEWGEMREKTSVFFRKFMDYYSEEIAKTNLHQLSFIMSRPFNLLFALNEESIYFYVSNYGAFYKRTMLYKLNDNKPLTYDYLSKMALITGLHILENKEFIMCSVPLTCVTNPSVENDLLIKEEVLDCVRLEVKRLNKMEGYIMSKPIWGHVDTTVNFKKIFMVMPFGNKDLNDFYEVAVKETVVEMGLSIYRADDIFSNNGVMEDIWLNINESGLIIADLTERNPNVFYEVGIAHTLGKDVILISNDKEDIPFDLRHIRTILYQNSAIGTKRFKEKLTKTITSILSNASLSDID